ncbi:MAG: amidase family protein [Candidatus Aminicenantes bacterium]|nr:amidase family protein [Candidatus Aminicenantes bacterium]
MIKIKFLIALISLCVGVVSQEQSATKFNLLETTIAEIHEAYKSHRLTAHQLVEYYLKRIEAYDQSTRLNTITEINKNALKTADELDEEFKKTGKLRPLHGVPILVKDNFNTKDMQTAGGSLALKGTIPPDDAFQIKRLREAGAIIIAKTNMAEWAFSNVVTVSSLAGITRNPYDLTRVPAGSSGGTAAGVSANFALLGMGTDTGNSIRGPASHNGLVGIRSTMGLTSRDGIIPLYLRNDIGGPLARTVEDAVRVLEVIAGYDPADPITKMSEGNIPVNYTQFLEKDGLKGARLAVFRRYVDTETIDPQIKEITLRAIEELKKLGAEIIDPFDIPNYDELIKNTWCEVFQYDLNNYLATRGNTVPYKTLKEIYDSGLYLPYIKEDMERELKFDTLPEDRNPPCLDLYHSPTNIAFREAVLKEMDKYKIDAIIYPTWSNQPRKVGDIESPDGDNSQFLSPQTGMPAITIPSGYTKENLPVGLTFFGRPFAEPQLIKYVYSYEQATKYRKPPANFPELK